MERPVTDMELAAHEIQRSSLRWQLACEEAYMDGLILPGHEHWVEDARYEEDRDAIEGVLKLMRFPI